MRSVYYSMSFLHEMLPFYGSAKVFSLQHFPATVAIVSSLTTRSTDSINWYHSICKCIFDRGRCIKAQGISTYIGTTIHHWSVHTSQEVHEDLIMGNLQIADVDVDNIFMSLEIIQIWAHSYTCITAKNNACSTILSSDIFMHFWDYFMKKAWYYKGIGMLFCPIYWLCNHLSNLHVGDNGFSSSRA